MTNTTPEFPAQELHPAPDPVVLPESHRPAQKRGDRTWIWVFAALLVVIIGLWLWLTPPGWWEKLRAFGYSVCHQIPARSFHVHDHYSPLCARCTGMYLGALICLAFQWGKGRRGKFPPWPVIVVLALFFIGFGVDGVNSFVHFFPGFEGLYEPSNLMRLLTGLGTGIAIGAVLFAVMNQTLWRNWVDKSGLESLLQLFVVVALALLLAWAVFSDIPALLYPAMVLSGLMVPMLLSAIYTMVAVLILRRENLYTSAKELALPVLIGLTIAFLQVGGISLVRYLVTGTWEAINL